MKEKTINIPSIEDALITLNGIHDTIFNHLKNSLRIHISDKVRKPKPSEKADSFVIQGTEFDMSYIQCFTKLLWIKYLRAHPELVALIRSVEKIKYNTEEPFVKSKFNVFEAVRCKAEKEILMSCDDFIERIKENNIWSIDKSLFDMISDNSLFLNPVGCHGEMNDKVSKLVKENYPELYTKYYIKCKQFGFKRGNIGLSQIITTDRFDIANLFCSEGDVSLSTEFNKLTESINSLPKDKKLYFTYKLGIDLTDVEWQMLLELFKGNYIFEVI